jgi:transcriptional regulator with XRE-family HTH domain
MAKSIYSQRQATLCRLLVEARKERGMTQSELAKALRRNQSFVAKYEGGERRLDVIEFIEVALAIGVDPAGVIASILDHQYTPKAKAGARLPRKNT